MDYCNGIVAHYLQADHALFVNTDFCLPVNIVYNDSAIYRHCHCDILAVDFRHQTIFLCEVSYATAIAGLYNRLAGWNAHWPMVCRAMAQHSHLPESWTFRPWLFILESAVPRMVTRLRKLGEGSGKVRLLPDPRITTLEMVQPWKYHWWSRIGENVKPASIPESMQC